MRPSRGIALEISTHRANGTAVCSAFDCEREPVLRCHNPLGTPSADECIERSRHSFSKRLVSADRQLPHSAGMEDIGNIVATERVVPGYAKASECWRTVELVLRNAENILKIIFALGTGVIHQYV